jgi:hypothetical protein
MKVAIPLVLAVLALSGCGGAAGSTAGVGSTGPQSPIATTAPTALPSAPAPTAAPATPAPRPVTTADLDAMAKRIFPGDHPAGCGPFASCPVTDRLRARVEQLSQTPPGQPGPLVQFCRCQNGADRMNVASEVSGSGGVAHVTLQWGTTNTSRLDLIFVAGPNGQLLLDDTQRTGGGPCTSLYAPQAAQDACPA